MKKFFIIFILFCYQATYGKEWFEQTITEDINNFYYVGVSSKKLNEKDALEDAYADALKEAVRHNFGVMHDYVGQYAQSESDLKVRQNTLLYRSGVKIVGAVPMNKILIEDGDYFIAYRKVKYPKSEIAKEKERLKHTKEKKLTLDPVEMPEHDEYLLPSERASLDIKQSSKQIFPSSRKTLPTFSWIWTPIAGNKDKTEFMSFPLKIEFYPAKYLGLGMSYIYDVDRYEEDYDFEKHSEKTVQSTGSTLERNEVTYDVAFELKLYPIRTKWLSLGFGGEYVVYREKIYLGENANSNVLEETKLETLGKNATLKITLDPVSEDSSGTSLYMDYREFDKQKRYSVGLSFDY